MSRKEAVPTLERLLRARQKMVAGSPEQAASGTQEWLALIDAYRVMSDEGRAKALADAQQTIAELMDRAREARVVLRVLELSFDGSTLSQTDVSARRTERRVGDHGRTKSLVVETMRTRADDLWGPREVREALEQSGEEFTKANIESTMHRLERDGVLERVARGRYRLCTGGGDAATA